MSAVIQVIAAVIQIYSLIILARVLMSWVPMFTGRPLDPYNPIVSALLTITEPILAPVRRFTTFGMMDFSPIVVLLTLTIVARVLVASA